MATYLDIVNNVLIRLREEQVSTINESTYSALVARFVNDAKRIVESSWNWKALYDTITIPTIAGQKDYTLTGTTNEVKIESALNLTSKFYLRSANREWVNNRYKLQDLLSGSPNYFCVQSVNSSGNTVVRLYPQPEATYSLEFNVIKHQADLSSDADVLLVPSLPVEALAFSMMVAERGESGGLSSQELLQYANTLLSDAIALDANNSSTEDLVFRVV